MAALLQSGEQIKYRIQILFGNILLGERAHVQILLYGHLQKNPPSLRHMCQTVTHQFVGIHVGDVLIHKGDSPASGVHQTGYSLQNGTLSGAVGTDQRHNLTLIDLKGYALDGMDSSVIHMNIVDFQQHITRPPFCRGKLR